MRLATPARPSLTAQTRSWVGLLGPIDGDASIPYALAALSELQVSLDEEFEVDA